MFGARRLLRSSSPISSNFFHPARIRSPRGFFSTTSDDQGSQRIRVISCDVTGTLVSFLGRIEDHYGNAARTCGVEIPPEKMVLIGPCFNQAYHETSSAHPCFGNSEISAKDWWRRCVQRSFELVGTTMTAPEQEMVFQRVYSKFGSHAACEFFFHTCIFINTLVYLITLSTLCLQYRILPFHRWCFS